MQSRGLKLQIVEKSQENGKQKEKFHNSSKLYFNAQKLENKETKEVYTHSFRRI